ncbi:lipopolysaccharide 1,2-glucosyltransferase [Helicobacter pylori]|uniref:HP0159 family lipopolysaccharide 1,6-glucosyltransferase n=1 Tax=Helicobacter pylori TaxID=210 RepID=UPI0004D3B2FF|nr:glycosyltransferase family 8 protein [Helicobacter pylori]KEY38935.1 lipopolysaccharide 1,2-glucosyltransferase [Helicobacter pylori]OOQ13478.1 lipopolysaccharide 1,2-glucosyltransferase [Helicobacter pylori]PDW49484.1 lipopolysaccharide 1,2-glucosyltransferase [Helicobacter pylori]
MSIIIPIVIAFDNSYTIPAGVSLYSMLACAKTENPKSQNPQLQSDNKKLFYKIHCLVDNLSLENQQKLKETLAPFSAFASVDFLDISDPNNPTTTLAEPSVIDKIHEAFLQLNIYAKTRFSKMVMCRLFLASLFPQYDKIIMFDADTLFLNDVSESFFIPLDSYYFGAAKDFSSPKSLKRFQIEREREPRQKFSLYEHYLKEKDMKIICENHYNVGFLIVNLKLWRADHLEERLLDLAHQKGQRVFCPEQDLLTLACYQKVLQLPYIYNAHPFMVNQKRFIPDQQEIVMLHFYFVGKPWISPTALYSKEWHEILLKTPFYAEYSVKFLKQMTECLSLQDKQKTFEFLAPLLNPKTLLEYVFFRLSKIFKRLKEKLLNS